ncbi:MAG TPA: diacylglycerol kinase family protein [Arthrobacter sp.]|nr:diacylglycerol kinase family protein [Arthrobacter sp.]
MTESSPWRHARFVVAVNPRAAFGAKESSGPRVEARLRGHGIEPVVLQEADYSSLERAVASQVKAGLDALIVVGGDGMVNLGVNALAGTGVPLGIVPSGTGNDVARMLDLPRSSPEAAVDRLLAVMSDQPRYVDLGLVTCASGSRYFAAVLSAGFDAVVNERANRWSWPRGRSRYIGAMLRELATFRPISYRLEIDGGEPRDVEAMLISVANGKSMGGGMRITPGARYDDGELDLFVVSRLSRLGLLAVFPKVFSGRHTGHRSVHIERVSSVRLEARGVIGYADGERVGPLPCLVEVVRHALRVLA